MHLCERAYSSQIECLWSSSIRGRWLAFAMVGTSGGSTLPFPTSTNPVLHHVHEELLDEPHRDLPQLAVQQH